MLSLEHNVSSFSDSLGFAAESEHPGIRDIAKVPCVASTLSPEIINMYAMCVSQGPTLPQSCYEPLVWNEESSFAAD